MHPLLKKILSSMLLYKMTALLDYLKNLLVSSGPILGAVGMPSSNNKKNFF